MHISLRWRNYQGGKIQKNKVDLLKEQYLNNNIFLSTHEGQDVYSVMIWNMNKKAIKIQYLLFCLIRGITTVYDRNHCCENEASNFLIAFPYNPFISTKT